LRLLDERTEWSDLAEQCVCIPRIAVGKDIREESYLFRFVPFCIEYGSRVCNIIAKGCTHLDGYDRHLFAANVQWTSATPSFNK